MQHISKMYVFGVVAIGLNARVVDLINSMVSHRLLPDFLV